MIRHLTAPELAAELGRSADWLYNEWARLVAEKKLPPPISGSDGGKLAWSAAQVYAYLDRDLPPPLRAYAAAFRAASVTFVATLAQPSRAVDIAEAEARLDRRFEKGAT